MDTEIENWQTRKLYKYRVFDVYTTALLVNRELYFAATYQLNDPYDCQISVTAAINAAIVQTEQETVQKILAKLQCFLHGRRYFAEPRTVALGAQWRLGMTKHFLVRVQA